MTPVRFSPGEKLIEGADDRDCYFIVSGLTEVTRGAETLGRTDPGEPEGEMAMFFRKPRVGTTTALNAVEALRLAAHDFDEYAETHSDDAKAFQMGVTRHLGRRFGIGPAPSEST